MTEAPQNPSVNLPQHGLLSVDFRKTDVVDFVKPLKKFIKTTFGEDTEKEYEEPLKQLQALREGLKKNTERSENSKELLYRYYFLLMSMEKRFPVSESNIRLNFAWYDVWKKNKYSRYSIPYERICVLFNIGALISQLAGLENRTTPEGNKKVCYYLQNAAGVFEYVKEFLQTHQQEAVGPDLSQDFLNMIVNLMLAQAQECFFEKALKDGMKETILSKLANQVADYYFQCVTLLQQASLKNYVDKYWLTHCELFGNCYRSITHYFLSNTALANEQYGAQVGHLQTAVGLFNQKKFKEAPKEVQAYLSHWLNFIGRFYQAAVKDNDIIFHQNPVTPGVPELKQSLVKFIPPIENPLGGADDLFAKLVPFAITQAASIYSEKKGELIRGEGKTIEEQNEIARKSLTSMNLPGSLLAVDTPEGIPTSLQAKIQKYHQEGKMRAITDLMSRLDDLRGKDAILLSEAIKLLDSEEQEDSALRLAYKDNWIRTPSHTLTSQLRQEGVKYSSNLEHGLKSDTFLVQKFSEKKSFISKFENYADIEAMIPASGGNTVNYDTTLLKSLLQSLDSLIAQRQSYLNDMRQISEKDDATDKLIAATLGYEMVYATELKKYDNLLNQLKQNYKTQTETIAKISEENDKFIQARKSNTKLIQREKTLQSLDEEFKFIEDFKKNLREGIQFYTNFQDYLLQFKRKCEDFVFARKTELNDLKMQIAQQQYEQTAVHNTAPPNFGTAPQAWNPQVKPTYQQQAPTGYAPMGMPGQFPTMTQQHGTVTSSMASASAPPPSYNAYVQQQVMTPQQQMGTQLPPPYGSQANPYGQPQGWPRQF